MLVGSSQEKCCHIKSSAYLFAIKVKNAADLVVKQEQPALYFEELQDQCRANCDSDAQFPSYLQA